jgi:lysophospholipid acyltransferase (LPLAT)-like uncharacterized protein
VSRRAVLKAAETLGPLLVGALGGSLTARLHPRSLHRRPHAPVIYAFWHGRMLVPAATHRGRRIGILVSIHRDGEYIARVVDRLGFATIRGSTTRGGVPGLKGMLRHARAGFDIAFTPDGPRGPRYRVQPGVIYAASRTGLPVLPTAVEANPAWILGSWDEFTIPKPFARAVILSGEPMPVPPDLDRDGIEAYRRTLEEEMHRLTSVARRRVGIETPAVPGRYSDPEVTE